MEVLKVIKIAPGIRRILPGAKGGSESATSFSAPHILVTT
jgi:hypothetical protein